MNKIETLPELETLKNKILKVNVDLQVRQRGDKFLDLPSSISSDLNAILDKSDLQKKIIISPEVARFLVKDDGRYQKRVQEIDRIGRPLNTFFRLMGNAVAVFMPPEPLNVVYRITKMAGHASELSRLSAEYDRLIEERDQIAGPVLGSYLLKRNSNGEYELELGKWSYFQFSVGQALNKPKSGVDATVDPKALPDLPDSPQPKRGL